MPGEGAHKFSLRLPKLIVQAAKNSAMRERLIVLNEMLRQSGLGKYPGVEDLGKPATLVPKLGWHDQLHIGQGCIKDFHNWPSLPLFRQVILAWLVDRFY